MSISHDKLRRDHGFALVATLLLMILLTVVAVGLLTLSTISMRSTARDAASAAAKANARLALALALAQLQKQTGPDTRITATADIGAPTPTTIPHPAWCGVWRSNSSRSNTFQPARSDFFTEWLVTTGRTATGIDAAKTVVPGESVAMRTAGATPVTPEVRVPVLAVPENGRLAWWTDDESAKARADLPLIEPESDAERDVARHAANRTSPEALPDIEGFKPTLENSHALVTTGQLPLAADKWPDATGRNFTTYSRSVLSNVRDGGLKSDLSALFEQKKDDIKDFGDWKNTNSQSSYLYGSPGIALGARWNQLYAYYNLYKNVTFSGSEPRVSVPGPPIDWHKADSKTDFGDDAGGFHYPRLAKVIYLFSYSTVRNPNPPSADKAFSVQMTTDIFVTLWNPFDARIIFPSNATAYIKFSKVLPLKFDWKINGVSRSKVGLEQLILTDPTGVTNKDALNRELFVEAPLFRPGSGAQFTMAPGETITFSIKDATNKNFHPGTYFENRGVVAKWLLGGEPANESDKSRDLMGRSSDRISVGVEASDSAYAANADGLNTSQYLDFWIYDTVQSRPYYEHRGDIMASQDADFANRMPEVPSTKVPARSFSSATTKQPFAAMIIETKTANESLYPVPAFLTSGTSRLSSQVGANAAQFMNERLEYRLEPITGFDSDLLQVTLPSNPAGPDHGYIGSGRGPELGQPSYLFSSMPSEPLTSLSQFRHAGTGDGASVTRATSWGARSSPYAPYADQAIGNSYAHPMLPPDQATSGNLLDNRYLGNEALWDKYFLSSLAPKSARFGTAKTMKENWEGFLGGTSKLINPRFSAWLGGKPATSLVPEIFGGGSGDAVVSDAYRKIAARLMYDGGFNVNSTSVDAWQAFLASTRKLQLTRLSINGSGGGNVVTPSGTVFSRTNVVLADAVDSSPSDVATHYNGYRDISDTTLRKLAEKIVEQVRKRGPFLNVSEFVNRRLTGEADLALSGPLQTAIDDAGLNEDVASEGSTTSGSPGGAVMAFPKAAQLGGAAGNTGWLMQGDILDPLGPSIVVRGDTFRIRGYGESRDNTGAVQARAWCEAVVQRDPDFMDSSEAAQTNPPLKPVNILLGRRYEMVSFRWLAGPES